MKKYLLVSITILSVAALGFSLSSWLNKPKTAYVDLGKVYSEFELKKELGIKMKQVEQLRQVQLDSMKLDLTVLAKNLQSDKVANYQSLEDEFKKKRQEYAIRDQAITEENDDAAQQYDDQIWKQLNQYMKEFGKENGYKYIFGAEGSGAIMYADDADNITEQMLIYVNRKYKGAATK